MVFLLFSRDVGPGAWPVGLEDGEEFAMLAKRLESRSIDFSFGQESRELSSIAEGSDKAMDQACCTVHVAPRLTRSQSPLRKKILKPLSPSSRAAALSA